METEKVIKSLEKLAEKLGTTAKEIMGIYIKNAKMNKVYFIIELILSLILLTIGLLLVIHFFPTEKELIKNYAGMLSWPDKNTFGVIIGSIIGIIGFISIIVVGSSFRSFINSWINPEYEAMEDLFRSLF